MSQSKLCSRCPVPLLVLAVFALLASPAVAQTIPAGQDVWQTPGDGSTAFTFPDGDVESLCGKAPDPSWNHTVTLVGSALPGYGDADTVVARLDDAKLGVGAVATVNIQVAALSLVNTASLATPCGQLNFSVGLNPDVVQPVTTMTIIQDSNAGGTFFADLELDVEIQVSDADSGTPLGALYYSGLELPDSGEGAPWSFEPPEDDTGSKILGDGIFGPGWFPGVNPWTRRLIRICRRKFGRWWGRHCYFLFWLWQW